ncbi:MAG: M48 family peptidase, partial [Pseudomonadota bacterium]
MASTLTLIFITLLIATTLIRTWLGRRHIDYVQAHRHQVPAAFSGNISLDAHQKAADYTTAKSKLVIIEAVVQAALLAALTVGGGLQLIDDIW